MMPSDAVRNSDGNCRNCEIAISDGIFTTPYPPYDAELSSIRTAQANSADDGDGFPVSLDARHSGEYFFLHCSSCGAELAFGQRKDGGLFPRRKVDSGSYFEENGWRRYKPQRAIEASAAPAANTS
jgi:hypothetical protein